MTTAVVVIPWRDRGRDPARVANLRYVLAAWEDCGLDVHVVSDGRTGDDQFCRSAAYNRAVASIDAEVFVFAEADMLIDFGQVHEAVRLALLAPGLVIPFTEYRALSPADTEAVLLGEKKPQDCVPELVMGQDSVGALNVVSRVTVSTVGRFDEQFAGSWFDDTAMFHAFTVAVGPARWVQGPAWHLFHLPGASGAHLTAQDQAATAANERRWHRYEQAQTPEEIRALTLEGAAEQSEKPWSRS